MEPAVVIPFAFSGAANQVISLTGMGEYLATWEGSAMGIGFPPPHKANHELDPPPALREWSDVQSLLAENARLRELVVRLSDIILRNMMERQ
jgi:hypothetical protein